jgi:hypothetical protein
MTDTRHVYVLFRQCDGEPTEVVGLYEAYEDVAADARYKNSLYYMPVHHYWERWPVHPVGERAGAA